MTAVVDNRLHVEGTGESRKRPVHVTSKMPSKNEKKLGKEMYTLYSKLDNINPSLLKVYCKLKGVSILVGGPL